jgi:hypothetical protein
MSPQTLAELRKYGVTDETQLKIEYFFYTDTEQKAAALSEDLRQMGYSGEYRPSVSDPKIFIVNGWTTKMSMDESIVVGWARQMCEL